MAALNRLPINDENDITTKFQRQTARSPQLRKYTSEMSWLHLMASNKNKYDTQPILNPKQRVALTLLLP